MQTTYVYSLLLVWIFLGLSLFGCAKADRMQKFPSSRAAENVALTSEGASESTQPLPESLIQFGEPQLGGSGCVVEGLANTKVEREGLLIPDFVLDGQNEGSSLLVRATCGVAVAFSNPHAIGLAVTGIELEQERSTPVGTTVKTSAEVFLAGEKGPHAEDLVVGTRNGFIRDVKTLSFAKPLIICGVSSGILRLNVSQLLEKQNNHLDLKSKLSQLRVLFTPIQCTP